MIEYLKIVEERKINMKFLDAEFVKGFIRMANDGWEQGLSLIHISPISVALQTKKLDSF